jgi:glycosyltransferase involved in cell wall biosynthesis
MMCGCTPVATDCPTGPSELLGEGKYGYLVPVGDTNAMASAISQALDRPITKNILQEAIKPFEEEAVIAKHFAALDIANLRA